jgi:hypothetical protein
MSNEKSSPSDIEKKSSDDPGSSFVPEKLDSPVLIQVINLPPENLLGETRNDLNPCKIALVDGSVKALAGKRLLVD